MAWFLYDRDLHHERVKVTTLVKIKKSNFLKNSEIPLQKMPKNVV